MTSQRNKRGWSVWSGGHQNSLQREEGKTRGLSGPFISLKHVKLRGEKKKGKNTLENDRLVSKFKTLIYNDNPQRKTSISASDSQIGMADGWPRRDCRDEL